MEVILLHFSQFMEQHYREHDKAQGRLLLALSGGPDSMALFHLMLERKIPFEVAHVDHGWRQESGDEAAALKKMCQERGISFHQKRITPAKNDLENRAREERHVFFKEIIDLQGLKAVVLGHHADDLAETVLKRVFEGAHLFNLKGLSPCTFLGGVPYFRPLLKVRKKQILAFLEAKGIPFFLDPTNDDSKYLRSRLRKDIFPLLSTLFGKEITPSLCRLSQHASELDDFIESFLHEPRKKISYKEGEITLNLEDVNFKTQFEWKVVVKDFFDRQGITPSLSVLETIVHHLKKKGAPKKIQVGEKQVQIGSAKLTLFL